MARALDLAERGRGRTSPNPMVGCVVVKDGRVVGEGWHAVAGGPHAEIVALKQSGDAAQGATIYVSLEPCSHHGRTPPCVDAIKKHKPARVVAAMEDPNPQVAGQGIAALQSAGIAVDVGVLEDRARKLNEAFVKYITTGRPFVIAKCAMTLDGKIATRTGHSQWVTGEAARLEVHQLRDEVDAILVGSRTIMLDDPRLTARVPDKETRDPIRIIVDAGEYLDSERRIFRHESAAPTWVAVPEGRDFPEADDVLHVPSDESGIDMAALMEALGKREITSLLIEGGGATLASAFAAGIVDKVRFYIAPKIVGGADAVTPVEGEGAASMDEAVHLVDMTATRVGDDLRIDAYVAVE